MGNPLQESALPASANTPDGPPPVDRLQVLLLQLWMTSKATIAERLDTLRKAQRHFEQNTLDDHTREQAVDAAHKLAGILGTFGLPHGTELARQIEAAMEADSTGSLDTRQLAATLDELTYLVNQKSAEIPTA